MRILHVIHSVDAAQGGPPLVASRLAAAQAGLGHPTALLAYTPREPRSAISTRLHEVPHGSQVRWIDVGPHAGPREKLTAARAASRLRELADDFDLAVIHGVWNPILLRAAAAFRRKGKPYVVVTHGMLDPWCLDQKRAKKKLALALAYRRMLDHAAFLHCLNADEHDLMAPLRLRPRAEIIPNGVFLEEFAKLPPRGSFHAAHPELGGNPFVLFLSRLHLKKGLDHLANAFALLARDRSDLRLVVAGPDDGYRAAFEALILDMGLATRTHLVGPLYGADKLAAFVDTAVFCLPSRQEGFSIAITEALACATPVVISADCHFPEVAQVNAGRVVPLEPSAIANALREVLDADRASLGRAGRSLVEQRFNWPKVADISIAAYRRIPSLARLENPATTTPVPSISPRMPP